MTEDPIRAGLNWYTYCGNNPVYYLDSSGLAPVPLRATAENAGFYVGWDTESRTASVLRFQSGFIVGSINFYEGDPYGSYIDSSGRMIVDDLRLNNFLYAPTGPAGILYNIIEDDFGKFILRNWLNGDGSDKSFDGGRWGDYLANNDIIQARTEALAKSAIKDGSMKIDYSGSLALTSYGGGYFTGYELINGSNSTVGGFQVTGIVGMTKAAYVVNTKFSFNDIIDPNYYYLSDKVYAGAAYLSGYSCNDYKLTITGEYNFTIAR